MIINRKIMKIDADKWYIYRTDTVEVVKGPFNDKKSAESVMLKGRTTYGRRATIGQKLIDFYNKG